MSYVSGFVVAVPEGNKKAYVDSARQGWALFKEYGALQHMEAWGDNVPDGKLTDFNRSVDRKDGEVVVFSWILWPDRETADAAYKRMMDDPRMKDMTMPFDGKRMIWGGFQPIFTASAEDGETVGG
jgi:uncharacterized protein YbaA (DUF1428 family)